MIKDKRENIKYPEIAEEIKKRFQTDQDMLTEAGTKVEQGAEWKDVFDHSISKENTERMKQIVAEIGWPSKSLVGSQASHMAWLLVQHSDHEPLFQEQCLNMMKDLPNGEVTPVDIAYLEDRVRVNTGKPQLYGTQFYEDKEAGYYGPRPIEDPEHVDERRASLGLETLAEYEKGLREFYKVK